MYNLTEIKSVHLEVTSKCQARCPMCPRRIAGGPLDPYIELSEITLEKFKEWFPETFIKQLTHLNMCGNLGDPIIAKDTLEIFKHLRSINPTMSLHMHTNGSARSEAWWKELAEIKIFVVFGIDGLEDTHSLYRIDTDWNKIIKNAKSFISAGGEARWDMLVFSHNEDQVESCKALSKELGFKDFYVKHTSRFKDGQFPVLDDRGKKIYTLYPTTKSEEMIPKIKKALTDELPTIKCKAQDDKMIYVSANGNLSPCCWLDLEWVSPVSFSRMDYLEKIDIFPNLNKNTLEEIFQTGYFNKISNCWSTTGLKECSKQCGSFDRLREQYIK